jgi:hypothetical protein
MRPTYETANDLDRERIVASYLERSWNCNLRKLSKFGVLDFAFEKVNEEGILVVRGFVEVKRRNCAHDNYPTILVSSAKRQQAISLLDATGCSSAFVIVYDDRVKYISLIEPPCYTTVGGRFDRGDKADEEVVLHYHIDRLSDLGPSPFRADSINAA